VLLELSKDTAATETTMSLPPLVQSFVIHLGLVEAVKTGVVSLGHKRMSANPTDKR
jgi:hypothetical protein